MRHRRMGRVYGFGVMAMLGLFVMGACSSGVSQEEADAKDQEIATLQSQVSQLQGQTTQLQGQVSALGQDSTYWTQLTSLLEPVTMPAMTDHRVFMLPTGGVIALHFDNLNLSRAENLNWVALGVPGVFCKDDQERVEAQFGPGFTHFHDMVNDIHGGAPGAEGVWFVHTAVRDFQAPWGPVSQGIDHNFMPTAAPECM